MERQPEPGRLGAWAHNEAPSFAVDELFNELGITCKSGYKQTSGKFVLMNTCLAKRMVTMLPRRGWWVGMGGTALCRIFLLIFGLKIKLIF